MTADERIISLIKPDIMERIPSFVRQHAVECACRVIGRDYPEMYQAFSGETEPDNETTRQMSRVVNAILSKRGARQHPQT